ncbi:hypothetical protein GJ744_004181 [Endocarpon pusillum]|uniref:Uncharacterized protein n=1 Tax=Endocarpon pusillum TaxID=364733 RepID=A0A8H7AM53_9EURO|nr:hypothetical protein GJ744_004181 [Endocarpon pusillum]
MFRGNIQDIEEAMALLFSSAGDSVSYLLSSTTSYMHNLCLCCRPHTRSLTRQEINTDPSLAPIGGPGSPPMSNDQLGYLSLAEGQEGTGSRWRRSRWRGRAGVASAACAGMLEIEFEAGGEEEEAAGEGVGGEGENIGGSAQGGLGYWFGRGEVVGSTWEGCVNLMEDYGDRAVAAEERATAGGYGQT